MLKGRYGDQFAFTFTYCENQRWRDWETSEVEALRQMDFDLEMVRKRGECFKGEPGNCVKLAAKKIEP